MLKKIDNHAMSIGVVIFSIVIVATLMAMSQGTSAIQLGWWAFAGILVITIVWLSVPTSKSFYGHFITSCLSLSVIMIVAGIADQSSQGGRLILLGAVVITLLVLIRLTRINPRVRRFITMQEDDDESP